MLRPLLTFTSDDCAHWDPAFEDDYGTSSAVSPSEQPFPLLFDAPRLGFPEADHSAFGTHSRAQSDLTSSAGTSDHLTAPPRRHSFNTQRPGTPFFLPESGPSTPETSLSPSPFHSPSCSRDTTLDLPVLYPEVASPAGVYAAGLRRKKVARFSCDLPLCNATFTTNHNLKNHKNSHTGTKPYACRLCGNRFTTASVKRRHEKNSHDAQDWAQLDS
ncbi:hypothetical protein K438DRAFT_1607372 [Mycena galopus ATCC 62051]|nr:hypothetical protein K438DRAFT_1607372 [Mycena galopus ATCC 62051]